MSDKCPKCGSPLDENGCFSVLEGDEILFQTGLCKDRQIANLEKRCQALAAHAVLDEEQISDLQASRDRWKELALAQSEWLFNHDSFLAKDRTLKAITAIREAGDWEE